VSSPQSAATPDPLQSLLVQCLDHWEDTGPTALEALCARHPEHAYALRQRIEALRGLGLLASSIPESLPERIGAYRVLRVLGRGGMGVVFEAEQQQPNRRVALKVLRSGLESPTLRARFAHEALLLARLQHPGIAQIYEAGSATLGGEALPFFAMELVHGEQVTEYAAKLHLDVPARLDLLARICDAVQHAHQKGVIHRDLKPSNILVDASGQPKLLDFGVARAVADDLHVTRHTSQGQLVGTLAYMSPEQATAEPDAIDTRSDVYSLGVIAHELLAGSLPYDVAGLRLADALRVITQQPPARLRAHDATLTGDVETIVLAALAKDRERRYASAEAFASDIRRHLRNEPIAARTPTTWYTLAKFARRNRTLVFSASAVVLALALGLVGTLVGMFRAQRAQRDAETRWVQAQAIVKFQRDMLAASHPFAQGRDARIADIVDRAARELDRGSLREQPEVEGKLRLTIGEAYAGLGLQSEAQAQARQALTLLRSALGDGAPETMQAVANLVHALTDAGELEHARRELANAAVATPSVDAASRRARRQLRAAEHELLRAEGKVEDALQGQRALYDELRAEDGADFDETSEACRDLANLLRAVGRGDEAVTLMQDLVRSTEARYGAGNARTLKTQIALATALQTSGRIRDSHALTQQLRQAVAAVFAKDDPESLALLAATAHNAGSLGEHALAEAAYRDLVEVAEKNFGPNSTNTNIARNNLAHALMAQQKWDASEAILRPLHTALAADPQRGPHHVETLHVAHSLGNLLARASRPDEALAVIEPLVPACKERLGPAHRITLETMHQLGSLYMDLGRLADAEAVLREATTTARRELKPTNFLTGKLLCELGNDLTRMDRLAEAEPILLEAHAWLARTVGADHGMACTAAANLVALYRRWAKPEQAATWEAKAGSR